MADAGFYGVATVQDLIGDGVSGSRWATLNGVVKVDSPGVPYTVANEYICGMLGLIAGLPVPPGTIAKLDDGSSAFVMLRFGLRGDKPPPASPSALIHDRPSLAARIAVFDCWVLNPDRHAGNLAYIPGEAASVYDHGHALLGTEQGKACQRLTALGTDPLWAGVLVPELRSVTDLLGSADRMRAIDDEIVRDICDAPRRLGCISTEEAKAAADALTTRKKRLTEFVEGSKALFTNIPAEDWGITNS